MTFFRLYKSVAAPDSKRRRNEVDVYLLDIRRTKVLRKRSLARSAYHATDRSEKPLLLL